jgi:hypothetical protein
MIKSPSDIHPEGEAKNHDKSVKESTLEVETYDGKLFVEWDPDLSVTPMGQLPFFIEFLKLGGCFDKLVSGCPLVYKSNNAPQIRDVLGSLFLSILSGHKRYAHISMLFNDHVSAGMLGMDKFVGEDSARRALKKIPESSGTQWLQENLQYSYEPLLETPWILDVDTTVKPLYGNQEGAVVGYNPHKPGRPSHTYHTYILANLRLVLEVEVQAGNQSSASYSMPGLVALIERLGYKNRPVFVRGDCDFGSEPSMCNLEAINMAYLFKLKQSSYVKKLIKSVQGSTEWVPCKDGIEALNSTLKLSSWSRERRVIVTRKKVKKSSDTILKNNENQQVSFDFIDEAEGEYQYKYAVLVTTLDDELLAVVQHYCDRADCENLFDEVKNQWGWGGFATQDLASTGLMAKMIGLVYNWWTLFVRMINSDEDGADGHQEAITSRPLLLTSIGRVTETGRQQTMTVSSQNSKHPIIKKLYQGASAFFKQLKTSAQQLRPFECWKKLLARAVRKIIEKQVVKSPPALTNTS